MAKKAKEAIVIKHNIETVQLHLKGKGLICHRFGEKARKMILDKQTGKKVEGKAPKNPKQQYEDSLYRINGGYGFPAVGFKLAAVRASKALDFAMVDIKCGMHVRSEENDLVTINGKPTMREDTVSLNGGAADIRFRGEFKDWKTTLVVDYDPTVLSVDQLIAIFARAGKFVGVGDWRVERGGVFGTWEIEGAEMLTGAKA